MDLNENIVARIYALRASIKEAEAEVKDLVASLGDLPEGSYVAGDYLVKATPTKRFDPATAKRNLTDREFKGILKSVPDSALAKAKLDEETYALCQKVYGMTVKVEVPDE